MTAEELAEAIEDLLRSLVEDEDGDAEELHGASLASFKRAGLLTSDAGIVITLKDGAEYQVRVIQSRAGCTEEDDCEDGTP